MKTLTVETTKKENLLGWIYMFFQLLILPDILIIANIVIGTPLDSARLNFIYFAVNFLCVTVIFRKYLIACGKIALASVKRVLQSVVYAYAAYWGLSLLVGMLILYVYPQFNNVNDATIQGLADTNYTLTAIGTILLVPTTEEALYRGLIFQGLYKKSRLLAYAVSALAFCVPHVIGYIGAYTPLHLILCFVQYLPAGLVLAWAYERTDSIITPILLHTLVNLVSVSALIVR